MNSVFRIRAVTISVCILFLMGLSGSVFAADGQHWQWANTLPQGNTLNAVAWDGGGTYIAVGDLGTVLSSANAQTWSHQSAGVTDIFNAVTWGAGVFVAADNNGHILTSPDGITWTTHATGSYNALDDIAWNGSLFVAVGGSGEILTSADGLTWTTRVAPPVSGKTLYAVAWNGSRFVAVGESGTIRTSSDGINWVTQSSGTSASLLYDITWGGSQWVAVGDAIVTSPDGINWTKQNPPSSFLESVAWNGSRFVAVGGSLALGALSLTSADGVNWTAHRLAPFGLNSLMFDGSQFVAVGDGGKIATSTDGVTWTSQTQNIFDAGTIGESLVSAVTWFSGAAKFIAVTNSGMTASSTDGTNWVTADSGSTGMEGLACNSSLCVAVGSAIYTTGNGSSWTKQTSGTSRALRGITWDSRDSLFVAVGESGTILTSPDGRTWISRTSGTTNVLNAAGTGGGQVVVVGLNGTILTSADGVAWISQTSGTTNPLGSVAYNGSSFVVISQVGDALTSPDGVTWSAHQVSSMGSVLLDSVVWDGQVFVTGGAYDGGKVFTSPDGVNWIVYQTGANAAPRAIASNGSASAPVDVIGGDYGSLLVSIQPAPRNLANATITQPQPGSESFTIQGMGALSVGVSSSDQALLPDANISGASGCTAAGNCTLTLKPAANQTGTATVTVTVTDGYGQSGSGTFQVTVNPPPAPAVSGLSGVSVTQPNNGSEAFTVSGTGALTVTASSSNQTLLPDANISGASGCTAAGNCTLTLQPAANQSGTATVTVTVTDGYGQSGSGTFKVTVQSAPGGASSGGGGSLGWLVLFALSLFVLFTRRRYGAAMGYESGRCRGGRVQSATIGRKRRCGRLLDNRGASKMSKRPSHTIIVLLSILLMLGSGAVTAKTATQTFIKPYPGSTVHSSWTRRFDRVVLPAGKVHFDNKTQNDVVDKTLRVEGRLTYVDYETPEDRGGLEVLENYKQGLARAGFKILFSCYAAECSKGGDVGYILNREQFGDDPSQVGRDQTGYLTAKLARPEGDVYATVIVDGNNHATDVAIVEAKPMQTGMVKVDTKALLNDINRTGHAAVYGIYFDTNKATVKPASKQALGAIAKLLKTQPRLKLYVVGHTDNVGTLDYNMSLSKRRAEAVVAVLVKQYGIAPGRLRAAGVGPLAPVLANTTEAGRAKNRRVELVAQ